MTPLEATCQLVALVVWVSNVRIVEQHMEFLFFAIFENKR